MLGAAAIDVDGTLEPVDVVKERTDGFGPLKSILAVISTIYANHKVRLRPLPVNLL